MDNRENNQALLNAIKNKFAGQNHNDAASYSPPKFTIPILKSTSGSIETSILSNNLKRPGGDGESGDTATALNSFLLAQLNAEKRHNGEVHRSALFDIGSLPKLKMDAQRQSNSANQFEVPLLKSMKINAAKNVDAQENMSNLSRAINNLTVEDSDSRASSSSTNIAIDLTTALSSIPASDKNHLATSSKSAVKKLKDMTMDDDDGDVNFEIPFIDCDRGMPTTKISDQHNMLGNEYCQTDVSNMQLRHSLIEPSAIGRIFCLNDKYQYPLPVSPINIIVAHSTKVEHEIKCFNFDTPSPDDIVLEALSKYRSIHQS